METWSLQRRKLKLKDTNLHSHYRTGRKKWRILGTPRTGSGSMYKISGMGAGYLTVKPGACPPDDGPCLSVPDQCLDDSQCPSTTKCCSKACYLQCVPKLSGKYLPAPTPASAAHPPPTIPPTHPLAVVSEPTTLNPCVTVKRGVCPKDLLRCISPIQHLCQGDFDCSGSKRCCLTACGRDCRSPVKGRG